jgi:CRISPR-associated protein Csh2
LEAIWNGTKGLLTRSKKGHMPRLLIKIDYREDTGGFFIGDLVERLKIKYLDGKSEESLADVSDLILDISALNAEIKKNTGKIASVKVLNHDERLSLSEPVHQI